jgi:sugar lactone lactonase YvrE
MWRRLKWAKAAIATKAHPCDDRAVLGGIQKPLLPQSRDALSTRAKRKRLLLNTFPGIRLRLLPIFLPLTVALLHSKAWAQSAPPNDFFTNAIFLSGSIVTTNGSNVGASKETGEPGTGSGNLVGGKSVWWRWTAPSNGVVTVDTIGSSFDTILGAYTGSAVNALSAIFGSPNDDGGGNGPSKVTFTATAGGVYSLRVDGYNPSSFGANLPSAYSGNIVLNVRQGALPPAITNQPKSQEILTGGNATFSVSASGTPPLSFQWLKDSAAISNATSSTYTIVGCQPSDSGTYTVLVSNLVSSTSSSNAVLTVGPIIITRQPTNTLVGFGYPANLTVTASGLGVLAYQWFKDGTTLSGSVSSNLSIASAAPGDAGNYSVLISSGSDYRTSSIVSLTVLSYTFGTFAGVAGKYGYANGKGSAARFGGVDGLALDPLGNLYVAEWNGNNDIRKITPDGTVSLVAGTHVIGTNDGPGSLAQFYWPEGGVLDTNGNLFVSDNDNNSIRKLTPDGTGTNWTVTTLAGVPPTYGWTDGAGSSALFKQPNGLAMDAAGNIYVAEYGNSAIRKITPAGYVTTFAASKALISQAVGAAISADGNLFVTCQGGQLNSVIKVTPGGVASVLAQPSGRVYGGAVDAAGNFYFTRIPGPGNLACSIRMITPGGIAVVLAGSDTFGSADGAGAAASFSGNRNGVAVDTLGNIYVADYYNSTVRKGVPFAVTVLPQSGAVPAGTPVTLSTATAGTGPFFFQWSFNGSALQGQTNLTLDLGPATRADSGVYSIIISNTAGNWISFDATVRALLQPVLQPPQITAGGNIRLLFQDADGGTPYDLSQVSLQWRTNLPNGLDTNWQTVNGTFYLTNGFAAIDQTNSAAFPSLFYRIVER